MNTAYSKAGVRSSEEMPGFKAMLRRLAPTFDYAPGARPVIDFGYYANVIPVAPNLGIAISTDGVGSKILVAEALGRYDTIGIDCVAMNVNDVICVGADPVSMVDYIAVEAVDDVVLEQLGVGFAEGARQAGVSIPGGELAQLPEMLRGHSPGSGLDLVGTCIGTVALDRVLTGAAVRPGDAIIGVASSGIHSNGLTLARRVLTDLNERIPEFSCTAGEELLKPTAIYVRFARELFGSAVEVHALAHITGDGFLNLSRMQADVSFELTDLPEPQPVFQVIRKRGSVPLEEMYRVFNMGVGLVAIVPAGQVDETLAIAARCGHEARRIGSVSDEPGKKVHLRQHGLTGQGDRFLPA